MVISKMEFIHDKGERIIHYCSVCGVQYMELKGAEKCESWHKKKKNGLRHNINYSSKITNKINSDSNLSNKNVIKYNVIIRRADNLRIQELKLEASNIREAAAQIRENFPRHSGFQIRPVENPSKRRIS